MCAGPLHPAWVPAKELPMSNNKKGNPSLPQKEQSMDSLPDWATWRPFTQSCPWLRKALFSNTRRAGHQRDARARETGTELQNTALQFNQYKPAHGIIQTIRHFLQVTHLNFPNTLCSVVERVGLGFRQTWLQISFCHLFTCGHL